MEDGCRTPHIAVFPTPGMGHLIPYAEFAKRLVSHHGASVTFITLATLASKAEQAFLDALPKNITSVALPSVPMDDVPHDALKNTIVSICAVRSLPALRDVLCNLKKTKPLVAFVADLWGGDMLNVARELGVPPYIFFPSNFLMLSLMLHLPTLDATTTCHYRDLPVPLELPGCVPLPGSELPLLMHDRTNDSYQWFVHHARRYREAEGILVNTFDAIEEGAYKVLREDEPGQPPVYPVGPLIRTGTEGLVDTTECLKWLDKQSPRSVLFVSFGSAGMLTRAQLRELALGLEASGQRFLWVVRSPSDIGTNAAYFNDQTADDTLAYLPEGFVERTKGIGLLVPSWAPQIQVLAHLATGGFLSHCGWNSTLESVMHGVPMIAWPLYAEQSMNAVMLVEVTKIALRPAAGADGLVGREEISRVVKGLMDGEEGKAVRSRVRELQEAAAKALDEEGSSFEALTEVVTKWKSSTTM